MTLVGTVMGFVGAHPEFAYGIVFLLALSEAVPFIGAIVPGSVLIVVISALAASGTLSVWPLLAAARDSQNAGAALSMVDCKGHPFDQAVKHTFRSGAEVRILSLWGVAVVASAWAFMSILEDVVNRDPIILLDVSIHGALQSVRTSVGDHVMLAITELGDPVVVLLVASIIFLWLIWQRHWRTAAYWAASTGFAAALNTGIKLAVHRARPGDLLYSGASEFSFPSGHSTVNTVMYGFLAFLIARQLRPAVQVPVFATALSLILLIAFSRLYLGAHWFSDVAASLCFASAWLIVMCVSFHNHAGKVDVFKLTLVAIMALAVVGSTNIYLRHQYDTQRYGVGQSHVKLSFQGQRAKMGFRQTA